jgi:hypothetical protein
MVFVNVWLSMFVTIFYWVSPWMYIVLVCTCFSKDKVQDFWQLRVVLGNLWAFIKTRLERESILSREQLPQLATKVWNSEEIKKLCGSLAGSMSSRITVIGKQTRLHKIFTSISLRAFKTNYWPQIWKCERHNIYDEIFSIDTFITNMNYWEYHWDL